MGYIYKIICNITNECYYGQSNGKSNRLNGHTCKCNKTMSKPIIERGNYQFIIIENDIIDDILLTEREYYYITNFDCVNKTIPYTINDSRVMRHRKEEKERYYSNQEHLQKKSNEYYLKNSESISEKRKVPIICECGKVYTIGNKIRHLKSICHIQYINK